MGIFSKKIDLAIGLDFSDLSVRFIQLQKNKSGFKVQALGKADLPNMTINDGEILKKEILADVISKMIKSAKIGKVTNNNVVACLPETKTFIKLISVEKSANALETIIGSEIEKNIPFNIDQMYFDWQIMSQSNSHYSILIGACPKTVADQYIEVLKLAKLNVISFEIEPVAISRCLLKEEFPKYKNTEQNNYAIIDIGAKRSGMFVYSGNTILFDISVPISSHQITKKIADTLEIDRRQAEKAKIICGLDKTKANGIISNVLSEMINNLTKKITGIVDYHDSHFSELGPIKKIVLCGGGANIKNLTNIIQSSTNIETVLGDSLTHFNDTNGKIFKMFSEVHKIDTNFNKPGKTGKSISSTQNTSLSFTTAIGLALRTAFNKNSL